MPIDEVKDFTDTIKWYDKNARSYAEAIRAIPSIDLIDRFVQAVGAKAIVLDAGCAAGRDSKLLQERNIVPIGIDISEGLLSVARERYPDIQFILGDFLNLPFQDETFDGVWAHASLVHLETIEKVTRALQEFQRVLKQNGIIHVYVKQQLNDKKTSIISDVVSGHDRFFRWFTKDEMSSLLKQTEFDIIDIQDDQVDPVIGREEIRWIVVFAKKNNHA